MDIILTVIITVSITSTAFGVAIYLLSQKWCKKHTSDCVIWTESAAADILLLLKLETIKRRASGKYNQDWQDAVDTIHKLIDKSFGKEEKR